MEDKNFKITRNQWKCGNCGIALEAPEPPKQCPSCHSVCEFLNVTCYEPDCQDKGRDERL